jgi:hypothetical protein
MISRASVDSWLSRFTHCIGKCCLAGIRGEHVALGLLSSVSEFPGSSVCYPCLSESDDLLEPVTDCRAA